jgi:hypothetical protein
MKINKRSVLVVSAASVLAFSAVFVSSAQQGQQGGPGGRGQQDNRPGQTARAPQAFIGIAYQPVETGIEVTEVVAESPAEAAGLQVGDIVNAINGISIDGSSLRFVLGGLAAGDTASLSITRGEETLSVDVTLAEAPVREPIRELRFENRPQLGVALESTEDDSGASVAEVVEGSPAEAAGLQVGDVITAINGVEVLTPREAAEAVREAIQAAGAVDEPAETFTLTVSVLRDSEPVELSAEITLPTGLGLGLDGLPGLRGMMLIPQMVTPREDGSGFDMTLSLSLADPSVVTEDVINSLALLGISITPRDGEEGIYDLVIPSEALADQGALEMLGRGMNFDFDFGGRGGQFQMPGRGGQFQMPGRGGQFQMPGRGGQFQFRVPGLPGQGQQQEPGVTAPAEAAPAAQL